MPTVYHNTGIPCEVCGYQYGHIQIMEKTDPVPEANKMMALCPACVFTKMSEWIQHASPEELLLRVNYVWEDKILERAYHRVLAGEPFYTDPMGG